MSELWIGSKSTPKVIKPETIEVKATHGWGTYTLKLQRSILGKHSYLDYAKVERGMPAKVLKK